MKNIMVTSYLNFLKNQINGKANSILVKDANLLDVLDNLKVLAKPCERYGEESTFLPLQYKKILLSIISGFESRTEYFIEEDKDREWIKATCHVYFSKDDEKPSGVGSIVSFSSSVLTDDFMSADERFSKLEALAKGQALSRAITDAGIGLQFYGDSIEPEMEEEAVKKANGFNPSPAIVAAPISPIPATPVNVEEKKPRKKREKKETSVEDNVSQIEEVSEDTEEISETVEITEQDISSENVISEEVIEEVIEEVVEEMDEEPSQPEEVFEGIIEEAQSENNGPADVDLDEAKRIIADIGKGHEHGWTLGFIAENYPKNLFWMLLRGTKNEHAINLIIQSDESLVAAKEEFMQANIDN